jgi:putative endonuclease
VDTRLGRADLARRGEDIAADLLARKGYAILARNHRFRSGEIDLIALDGRCVVFVEVKTRSGTDFPPEEAVDGRKQQRLRKLALQYMAEAGRAGPCRFDVVAVRMRRSPPYEARADHYRNAF